MLIYTLTFIQLIAYTHVLTLSFVDSYNYVRDFGEEYALQQLRCVKKNNVQNFKAFPKFISIEFGWCSLRLYDTYTHANTLHLGLLRYLTYVNVSVRHFSIANASRVFHLFTKVKEIMGKNFILIKRKKGHTSSTTPSKRPHQQYYTLKKATPAVLHPLPRKKATPAVLHPPQKGHTSSTTPPSTQL